jgi:hypothetical protein
MKMLRTNQVGSGLVAIATYRCGGSVGLACLFETYSPTSHLTRPKMLGRNLIKEGDSNAAGGNVSIKVMSLASLGGDRHNTVYMYSIKL